MVSRNGRESMKTKKKARTVRKPRALNLSGISYFACGESDGRYAYDHVNELSVGQLWRIRDWCEAAIAWIEAEEKR
jgi:hypothetical protein